ncbi:MAG: hypothetical protein ACLPXZ_01620 [Mycobacterium sp.]
MLAVRRRHSGHQKGLAGKYFPSRVITATLLTREGAYESAATRAFMRLTHEYVSQSLGWAADET